MTAPRAIRAIDALWFSHRSSLRSGPGRSSPNGASCWPTPVLRLAGTKKKPGGIELTGFFVLELGRRRPTLPRNRSCRSIGAEELNDRVRDGNGCGLLAGVTAPLWGMANRGFLRAKGSGLDNYPEREDGQAARPIRIAWPKTLLLAHPTDPPGGLRGASAGYGSAGSRKGSGSWANRLKPGPPWQRRRGLPPAFQVPISP